MTKKLDIKCSKCSRIAELSYEDNKVPDLDELVKCSYCNSSAALMSYLPSVANDNCERNEGEVARFTSSVELELHGGNMENMKLNDGCNVIGRKANSSKADIQLPVKAEKSRLSREHIVINVKKDNQGEYECLLSLFKKEVNETFCNNHKLEYEKPYALKNGDEIKLPDDMKLEFIIINDIEEIID